MGLNWSKDRSRRAASSSLRQQSDNQARLARATSPLERQATKAELQAEAGSLVANYRGRVRSLPTFIKLKCWRCGHKGTAKVQPGQRKRFRCSQCAATST